MAKAAKRQRTAVICGDEKPIPARVWENRLMAPQHTPAHTTKSGAMTVQFVFAFSNYPLPNARKRLCYIISKEMA